MPLNVNSGLTTAQITGTISSTPVFPVLGATQTDFVVANAGGKSGNTYTSGTGTQLFTVTGGKTAYVKSMSFSNLGTAINIQTRDSTTVAGGTAFHANSLPAAGNYMITYAVPVKVTNGLFLDVTASQPVAWQVTYFEV